MNGNPIDIGPGSENLAAIDTGTQFVGGPSKVVQAFWAHVNGSQEFTSGPLSGLYQFRTCNNHSILRWNSSD